MEAVADAIVIIIIIVVVIVIVIAVVVDTCNDVGFARYRRICRITQIRRGGHV